MIVPLDSHQCGMMEYTVNKQAENKEVRWEMTRVNYLTGL